MTQRVYEDFELVEQKEVHSPWIKLVFTVEAMPWGPRCTVVFVAPEELTPTLERILNEFKSMIEKKWILKEKDWERLAKKVKKELFNEETRVFQTKYTFHIGSSVWEQLAIRIY